MKNRRHYLLDYLEKIRQESLNINLLAELDEAKETQSSGKAKAHKSPGKTNL